MIQNWQHIESSWLVPKTRYISTHMESYRACLISCSESNWSSTPEGRICKLIFFARCHCWCGWISNKIFFLCIIIIKYHNLCFNNEISMKHTVNYLFLSRILCLYKHSSWNYIWRFYTFGFRGAPRHFRLPKFGEAKSLFLVHINTFFASYRIDIIMSKLKKAVEECKQHGGLELDLVDKSVTNFSDVPGICKFVQSMHALMQSL